MRKIFIMDKDSSMLKKKKDLFVNISIVTSRKRLKCNQIICDYMQLIIVYANIGDICDWKSHHTFFGQILWLCRNYL